MLSRSANALVLAVTWLFTWPSSLFGAEASYPKGASTGLVPPPKFAPATGFAGFQDTARNASIVIVEMPPEAYAQIVNQWTPEALKASGMDLQGEPADWPLAGAQARILRGKQTANGMIFAKWVVIAGTPSLTAMVTAQVPESARPEIPSQTIEVALRSITFRAPESLDEQLAALPFSIGDRAGLRVVRTIAGSGLYLTDGPRDTVHDASQPIVIVASSLGQAPPTGSRAAFARKAIGAIKQVPDVAIASETSQVAGPVEWSRIEGTGLDSATGSPMQVVQVVRFEGGGYVRVIGLDRASNSEFAKRTRRLADSITLR